MKKIKNRYCRQYMQKISDSAFCIQATDLFKNKSALPSSGHYEVYGVTDRVESG